MPSLFRMLSKAAKNRGRLDGGKEHRLHATGRILAPSDILGSAIHTLEMLDAEIDAGNKEKAKNVVKLLSSTLNCMKIELSQNAIDANSEQSLMLC